MNKKHLRTIYRRQLDLFQNWRSCRVLTLCGSLRTLWASESSTESLIRAKQSKSTQNQSKQPTVLLTPLHTEPHNLIIYNLILDYLFCVVCWRCLVWNTQAKYKIHLWEREFKLSFKFPACLLSQQGRWKRPKTESSLTSRGIPGTTTTKDTADYSNINGWVTVNSVFPGCVTLYEVKLELLSDYRPTRRHRTTSET